MIGPEVLLIVIIIVPLLIVAYNRIRVKGKLLCVIAKKDKSTDFRLCKLDNDFIVYKNRAYDVYPDFVRVSKFPMGWPAIFQELVPTALYDEEDGIPLDWIHLDNRLERAMELKAALDENFFRKLVHETTQEAQGGFSFNWRKILPIALLVLGVIGVIVMFVMRGNGS